MTWEQFLSYDHLIVLGIAIGVILLFLLLRKLFTKYIFAMLKKLVSKANNTFLTNILVSFEKPVQWLFIIIGIYFAVRYYPHLSHTHEVFIQFRRVAIIFLVSWGFFNLSSVSSSIFKEINKKTNIHIDEILIPFLSRTLQVIIVAISISVILQEFDYEIGGFVAGIGLGGLAFSLAAKDALANLFGGIVIITEKPFTIGDWIATPNVEGVVEDITFRSTRIRTFADALVTVPNATLADSFITNWSKMGKRQITFTLRLAYDTPASKIEVVVQEIQSLLENHPEVHPETIFVNFDQYKEYGVDLFLYFFTKTTDWGAYLKVREDINLKILQILERESVTIAIPSQKLYVDQDHHNGDVSLGQES
ncbi:mechanosensitive ion channel family protein [Oceanobacillus halotolerans]|uniref:mechanosensitive ion channel family protein n=1 Tax=Oceanobacillus halotolerans TaxID=2663380 RepID=UPI0013DA8718|nr:mechanosensitive ion channel family protein [Oceanobacillus halotolerans]